MNTVDVQISDLINGLGWYELNCRDKLLGFVQESIVHNSSYFLLLFSDLNTQFFHKKFYDYISKMTGVYWKSQNISSATSLVFLREKVLSNSKVILTIDEFYGEEYIQFYQKEHHDHYVILKGYKDNRFLIIDEDTDLRRQNISTGDRYGFLYKYKWILESTLSEIAGFKCDSNALPNFKFIDFSCAEKRELSLESISQVTKNYFQFLAKKIDAYMLNCVQEFQKKANDYDVSEWYLCTSDLFIHQGSFQTQTAVLGEMIDLGNIEDEVINYYTMIRNLFTKFEVTRNPKDLRNIPQYIVESFIREKEFYHKVISAFENGLKLKYIR